LVPVGDPAALAVAIRQVLEAPPPQAEGLDRFTPAQVVRQYRALWQGCHAQ